MAKKAQMDTTRAVIDAGNKQLDTIEEFLDTLDKVADKSTDVVENGLEKVADVVPDVLDTSVHVSTEGGRKIVRFFRNPKNTAITIVVLSTAAGAALGVAGYFALKKRLEAKLRAEYDQELESEIAEMRRFYALRNKEGFETPAAAVEALLTPEAAEALTSYQGGEPKPVTVVSGAPVVHADPNAPALTLDQRREAMQVAGYTEAQINDVLGEREVVDISALQERMRSGTPVEVTDTGHGPHNIFADGHPVTGEEEFDYEAEIARRTPGEPYVISHEQFMSNENDWTQHSVVYYNGDDTLVDSTEMPIPDIEEMIGSQNLERFGDGSRDPRIVYIRNEEKEMDFEVRLSDESFGEQTAGFIKHSAPPRRFRSDDDE